MQLLHGMLKRTWGGCDGCNELESWVCCDALCTLRQIQLAALEEADQAGQHVWGRQIDVLNQKPPTLAHRLRLHRKAVSNACLADTRVEESTGLLGVQASQTMHEQ